MTKPWETYEAIIKELYMTHTLATVRQTMQDEYGFNASVRAYRQKLDAWGCGKYKKREKTPSNSSNGRGATTTATDPTSSASVTSQQEQAPSNQHTPQAPSSSTTPVGGTSWPSNYGQDPGVEDDWAQNSITSSRQDGSTFCIQII
ncbi:hypothetical protein TruAng_008981 [Truncatella angustata]|nr:hypothetical protein TruAng_008981 [Truncatella angustata]